MVLVYVYMYVHSNANARRLVHGRQVHQSLRTEEERRPGDSDCGSSGCTDRWKRMPQNGKEVHQRTTKRQVGEWW